MSEPTDESARERGRAADDERSSRRAVTHQVLLPVDVARSSPVDVARINLRRVVRDDCGTDRGRDVDVSREEGGRCSNRVAEGDGFFSPRRARRRGTRCRAASPVPVARFEYQSSNPPRINFPRSARTRRARVTRGRAFPAGSPRQGFFPREAKSAGCWRIREGKEKVEVRISPMEPGRRADLPAP